MLLKSPGFLWFLTGRPILGALGFTRTGEYPFTNDVLWLFVSAQSQENRQAGPTEPAFEENFFKKET
jgi:hypothetical protein